MIVRKLLFHSRAKSAVAMVIPAEGPSRNASGKAQMEIKFTQSALVQRRSTEMTFSAEFLAILRWRILWPLSTHFLLYNPEITYSTARKDSLQSRGKIPPLLPLSYTKTCDMTNSEEFWASGAPDEGVMPLAELHDPNLCEKWWSSCFAAPFQRPTESYWRFHVHWCKKLHRSFEDPDGTWRSGHWLQFVPTVTVREMENFFYTTGTQCRRKFVRTASRYGQSSENWKTILKNIMNARRSSIFLLI